MDACQLLGLDAGKGADLIYGPDGKTYHVQVLRVKRVTSSKPPELLSRSSASQSKAMALSWPGYGP